MTGPFIAAFRRSIGHLHAARLCPLTKEKGHGQPHFSVSDGLGQTRQKDRKRIAEQPTFVHRPLGIFFFSRTDTQSSAALV
ncbi:hypothetical protein psal_cds_488 [Pandoravirus salinus]|uniref:Uncharacterized protein n=1 Tax=Pandoravirus salinus TaxID=1349410 RepID=S4W1G3_9VIRU|nr:hypothetical protein psal_cds_488 [Pandoravirus salinus]AGO84272.1 hypothetical protein psal_cds_488 [Pandoravirus salinus]